MRAFRTVKLLFIRRTLAGFGEGEGNARRGSHNHLAGLKSITDETMKLSRRYLPTIEPPSYETRKCRPASGSRCLSPRGSPASPDDRYRDREGNPGHTHESVTAIADDIWIERVQAVNECPGCLSASAAKILLAMEFTGNQLRSTLVRKASKNTDNEERTKCTDAPPSLPAHVLQMIIPR